MKYIRQYVISYEIIVGDIIDMAGSSESRLNLKPPSSSTCVNICDPQVLPVLMLSRRGHFRSAAGIGGSVRGWIPLNFASQTRTARAGVVRTFADDANERNGESLSVLGVRAGVCSTGPFPGNFSLPRSHRGRRASRSVVFISFRHSRRAIGFRRDSREAGSKTQP